MTLFPYVAPTAAQRSGTEPGTRVRSPVLPGAWTFGAAAYAAVLVGWLVSGWGVSSEVGKFILNLAFQPLNLAATIVFWTASRRAPPRSRLRLSLSFFASCYASICAGNTAWFIWESVLHIDPTFTWPNVPYLLSYVVGIAGLLALPLEQRSRIEPWRFVLDALLTVLGGGAVIWFVVIHPLTSVDLPPLHRAILLAFPIGALAYFVGLLTVPLRRPAGVNLHALRLFVIGEGASLLTDLYYQTIYREPSSAGLQWTYVFYAVSYTLVVWSGEIFARAPGQTAVPAKPDGLYGWSPLPWLAVAAVYGLLLLNAITFWSSSLSGLAVVAIVLTILLSLREAATVRQNVKVLRARVVRESESRFESLVRHSSDPLLVLDQDLVMRFASPAAGRVAGRTAESLVGCEFADLLHPDDALHARTLFRETIPNAGAVRSARWRIAYQSGGWRHLEVVVTNLLADQSVHGLVLTAHDVTERDSLEEQLRHAQKMEAIGQLAGGIAHDFNNLLTTILGTTELALERLPPKAGLRTEIEEIRTAGRRAATLTGQLLAFSRKHVIEAKILEVAEVVASTHRLLQRLIGEHINLAVHIEHDIGCVRGDVAQIEQALVNLIVNARDAIPETGTVTLEALSAELPGNPPDRQLAALPPGTYAALRVTDTGTGMDTATQERIFEPFFTTKGLGRGTGLGLATVYGTVQRHGGAITVRSAPGEGSQFTIYLPRVDRLSGAASGEPGNQAGYGKETILVVEDEAAVRRTTSRGLRSRGYTVLEAADGETAIELAESYPGIIELVLMDVILPGRSGPQIVADLHRIRPGMRVLYASGYTGRELTPHGLLASDVAFLQKPYSIAELTRRVREVLSTEAVGLHRPPV
jgi:PAS domain S-box-containing protein